MCNLCLRALLTCLSALLRNTVSISVEEESVATTFVK